MEIRRVMTEQLISALKVIETLVLGTMKVYGLPSGQGLDSLNDMALACGAGHIIPAVQAHGQSINIHSALSWGFYSVNDAQFCAFRANFRNGHYNPAYGPV